MRTIYICDTCGTKYETKEKAIQCEEKHKVEAEKEKKLAEEKEIRLAAVEEARKNYSKLLNDYLNDYGVYSNRDFKNFDEFLKKFLS